MSQPKNLRKQLKEQVREKLILEDFFHKKTHKDIFRSNDDMGQIFEAYRNLAGKNLVVSK